MATDKISESSNGVYIIAATPFADDGELDLASIDSLIDFYPGSLNDWGSFQFAIKTLEQQR